MDQRLLERCDLLEEYYQIIGKSFTAGSAMVILAAANVFVEAGKKPEKEKVDECKAILKRKAGIFSEFRGDLSVVILAKMAIHVDPEAYLDNVMSMQKKLQKGKAFSSSESVLAAMAVCDLDKESEIDSLMDKAVAIAQALKKNHRFASHEHDFLYTLTLAMKGRDIDEILSDIENNYNFLVEKLGFHNNAVYKLALVLESIDKYSQEDCERVAEIYQALNEVGVNYGKTRELPSLALLLNLDMDIADIAASIQEIGEYTKNKKGFKSLINGTTSRYMFATMILTGVLAPETKVTGIESYVTMSIMSEILVVFAILIFIIILIPLII